MRRAADTRGRAARRRPILGQHFLADERVLRRIVDALDPDRADVVLEIGPGTGTLTRQLAPRVGRVIAIEKDPRLAAECGVRNAERGVANVEIIEDDALNLDWHSFVPRSALRTRHFKIVGNVPYYITTPLLEKALSPPAPERVVFLVQAEVAERIVARPGSRTYGALSVGVQVTSRAERLFGVKPGAFRPPPEVDSAVIRLHPRPEVVWEAPELARFRRFVTACFSRRRKQLRNVLRGATGWPAERVSVLLERLELDPAARPESLSPERFVRVWQETLRGRGQL